MTSWKLFFFSYMIALFLMFFISSSSVASDSADMDGMKDSSSSTVNVNLSVYYETLSPSCASFIIRNLMIIFNNGLIDIINLRMVPWGNSHVNRVNKTMVCENGIDECELNKIQACAINVWHDVNKFYAFIYCIEFLVLEGRHQNWHACFSSLGLPPEPVLDCYKNGTGTKLEFVLGYQTAHLNPPHAFVPWVVVNNRSLGHDYANFTRYICNAYKGSAVPSACKLPTANMSAESAHRREEVKKLLQL